MRFVLAIVAFVVAAAMIAVGIAQRTVFEPPSQVAVSTTVKGDPRYIVIDGNVLNAHPGQQTLAVAGGPSKSQVVAYGRTADVKAWLGAESYSRIGYNAATGTLAVTTVKGGTGAGGGDAGSTPTPSPGADATTPTPTATDAGGTAGGTTGATAGSTGSAGPNPAGSDLWLEEFDGPDAALTRMNVPDSISVIVAADGTKPAPNQIRLVWPLDTSTPWSGPLIIGGLGLLVVGLALYLWGLYTLRKSRGPRRKGGPKMPKLPKAPKYKPSKAVEATPKGRRSTRRALVAVPIVLVGALALSGCSGDLFPQAKQSTVPAATPIATDLSKGKGVLPPAVTVPQLERIMRRVSAVVTQADTKADPKLAATRLTGAALELREANYTIRSRSASEPALPAIAPGPFEITLPQATDTWPRVVTAVLKPADKKQAPTALALVQKTARDNYALAYAISLEPDVKVPGLAPASIGAPVVPPDSRLLKMAPKDIAAAYADILMHGDASKSASQFDATGDTLRTAVGADYKAKTEAALSKTASLAYTNEVPPNREIAMATNDSGAIVWANLNEFETTKVVEAGAQITLKAGGAAEALLGANASKSGIEITYGYQLAFYVPPAGSNSKITLLGFAQGIIGAKEVQ